MKKLLLAAAIMSLLAVPALCDNAATPAQENVSAWKQFVQQQKQEDQAFRKTLKDMSPDQRKAAVAKHREDQHQKEMAFGKAQYTANRAKLAQKLAAAAKLTQTQKDTLLQAFDDNYTAAVQFREDQYKANTDFMTKLENDTTMTPDQKKAALQDYMKTQIEADKKFMQDQKAKLQAVRKSIKPTGGQNDTTPTIPAQ